MTFVGCDLAGAAFYNANANGSDFTRADLSGVVVENGQFKKCRLVDANLDGGRFLHANLAGADLTGALIVGTEFEGSYFDEKTAWPEGSRPPAGMNWAGKGGDPRRKA